MNLLVTGGSGFIGSSLILGLLRHSPGFEGMANSLHQLVNLDALTYAGSSANLDEVKSDSRYVFVHGDIRDQNLVNELFLRHDIDTVIHLAAESHVDRSIEDPANFISTNVEGTLRMLEAARRHWKDFAGKRFLHVSTDEVFGSLGTDDEPFTAATAYAPNSPYAASKAGGDHLARAYHRTYGLPVLTSHCSNNFGPRQFPEKMIPLMILNAMEERALPIYGDGQQRRDWIHVDDHARGLVAAIERGSPGGVYLFGGGSEITNEQLVRLLCRELDEKRPRLRGSYADLITYVQDRPGHDFRYAVNSEQATRELGWSPRMSFSAVLQSTVEWYLSNPEWCKAASGSGYHRQRLGLVPQEPF